MRNMIKTVLILFFITVSTLSYSQSKNFKFGHVSSEDIVQLMPERDSAATELQKFGKELEDQLEGMNVERNKKVELYMKEKATASDLVNKTREDEITQFNQRIEQFQGGAQQEYQQKQATLMQPILEKVQKAITAIGKEQGFTYIFINNSNVIPYISAESQDVTPLVKQKLGIKDKPVVKQ